MLLVLEFTELTATPCESLGAFVIGQLAYVSKQVPSPRHQYSITFALLGILLATSFFPAILEV